jgi:hypothetical protein
MRFLTLMTAAALALVVGCDKAPERSSPQARAPQATANTPANIGQPGSQEEKKDGANPVQGQVDPKQEEQHKDFQQRGDAAGPKSADTTPKSGG